MRLRYTNKKGRQTWAIIQQRNIDFENKTFEATYKAHSFCITTDHGHGKAEHKNLKRYDIVVLGKDGGMAVNTWQDLPNLRSAIMYALKGACLIDALDKDPIWEGIWEGYFKN